MVESLFSPEADPWLVRRIVRDLDGITQGDVKAALGRARISLDFPAAEPAIEGEHGVTRTAAVPEDRPLGRKRKTPGRKVAVSYDVTIRDLIAARLIQPGAELRKTHLGRDLMAQVEADGRIRFEGHIYNSLSIAAAPPA